MANPYLDISVYTDGSLKYSRTIVAPAAQYWRQPHDKEIRVATVKADITSTDRVYRGAPTGASRTTTKTIPEVFQALPDFGNTPLSPEWCKLIDEMNYPIKPELAREIYLDPTWAFNNVGGKPMWDKPRICGGALLTGTVDGSNLMIETLLTSDPVPSVDYVISRPWLWFWATEVNRDGVVSHMTLGLGDGTRQWIRLPMVFKQPVYLPLAWLHRLPAGYDAMKHDPLKVYL